MIDSLIPGGVFRSCPFLRSNVDSLAATTYEEHGQADNRRGETDTTRHEKYRGSRRQVNQPVTFRP